MKVAFLIAAHENPSHLSRLIDRLNVIDCEIFIHIDKSKKLDDFKKINNKNVTFIKDRVNIYWGGYSQVQATLNLLREAINTSDCDRYQLLSGIDYPIKPLPKLNQFLIDNDMEFITISTEITEESNLSTRIDNINLLDSELCNVRTKTAFQDIRWKVNELTELIIDSKFKDDHKKNIDLLKKSYRLFKGSNWFNLSKAAVEFILAFTEQNPLFVRAFKFSMCPDEMFFHTILGNSIFSDRICKDLTNKNKNTEYKLFSGLHHVNWNSQPAPKTFISTSDINELSESQAFFARKFNEESYQLLTQIDLQLLNISEEKF